MAPIRGLIADGYVCLIAHKIRRNLFEFDSHSNSPVSVALHILEIRSEACREGLLAILLDFGIAIALVAQDAYLLMAWNEASFVVPLIAMP